MAKKRAPIIWTDKQVKVSHLLQKGALNKDIAAQLGVAASLVTKVSKAMKQGFTPPSVGQGTQTIISQYAPGVSEPEKQVPVESAGAGQAWSASPGQSQQRSRALQVSQSAADATMMTLVPATAMVTLTPIMQNARWYLVQGLGWPVDTRWEDIIDTIIYRYFRSLNPPVVLQGWYVGDAKKTG